METFWGLSATAWTAIYTLLTFGLLAAAVVAGWYAKRQWEAAQASIEASRKAEIEASRPYVVVTVEPGVTSLQRMDLVVRNLGKRPAVNVRINLHPRPVRAREEERYAIANMKMLKEPIALIAPGQEIRAFYDTAIERKDRDDLPTSHVATVTYQDTSGSDWKGEFTLDLEALKGVLFAQIETIHDVSKTLKKIEETLGRSDLLKHGSIEVEAVVEPREQRVLRQKGDDLESILSYVGAIRRLTPHEDTSAEERRALELDAEIEALQREQRARDRRPSASRVRLRSGSTLRGRGSARL